MREILFRGICKDSKRWVYGYYVHFEDFSQGINNHSICSGYYNTHFEVIPETVGQDTGLKDLHGKYIFEGDIVKVENALVRGIFAVEYSEMGACFIVSCGESRYFLGGCSSEVIGNVFDSPELLEGDKT